MRSGESNRRTTAKWEGKWAWSGARTCHRPLWGGNEIPWLFRFEDCCHLPGTPRDSAVPSKKPAETDFFHCRSILRRVSQRICPTTPFLLLFFLVSLRKGVNSRRRGVDYAANGMCTSAKSSLCSGKSPRALALLPFRHSFGLSTSNRASIPRLSIHKNPFFCVAVGRPIFPIELTF